VTNIEKTLRKKQAESQTELDILRIKYGNLKLNYRSVDMQGGLQWRPRLSRNNSQHLQAEHTRQSCGKDSEVNIGLHKQSVDFGLQNNKMSPLARHKLQHAATSKFDPTPSTKYGLTGDTRHRTRNFA